MNEWMILRYVDGGGLFYTRNGYVNEKLFIKVAECKTREDAQEYLKENDPILFIKE